MNQPLKQVHRRMRQPKGNHHADQDRLLAEFGLISEPQLAAMLGVELKTLRNRHPNDLPPFTKSGAKRLFFKEDVIAFLRGRMNGKVIAD